MTTLLRFFLCALLLTSPLVHADMRVIQLQHRMDSEMIQLLQPMLNPWEGIAGNGQQLILRAESERLDELEQLIASLDTPLRRVLITLDDSGGRISSERGIDISARASGRHGEVVIGDDGNRGNRVDIRHYSTTGNNSGLRSIQTLEGSAAFIQTSQQIPQQQWSRDQYGRPLMQTVQRQLTQGFYVTPSIQGNRVTLELSTQNDHLSRQDSRIVEQNSLSTRIGGQLGEWIEIGGLSQSNQHDSSGILSGSKSYSTENNNLRIKVQLLDE